MKTVLFLTSHLGSGANGLINILNANPRIEMFCPQDSYAHPTDLDSLVARPHKLSNTAAIYGEYLWFNAQFSCKPLYNICKFIYVIRDARSSIGELISTHGYSAKRSALYYAFRLRRICEMAKRTPGAVLLTWNDMVSGAGLPLIEKYLRLKTPLEQKPFISKALDDIPHEIELQSQDCYERHLYFLRNLQLLKGNELTHFQEYRSMNSMKNKNILLAVLIIIIISLATALCKAATTQPNLDPLFTAIGQIESTNNPDIPDRDDNGTVAIGIYQIHEAFWNDSQTPGQWSDCHDPAYSRRVVINYWRRYCPKALSTGDIHTLAMVFHGGPHGSTDTEYWIRLRKTLDGR